MARRLGTTRISGALLGAVLAAALLGPGGAVAEELIGVPITVYGVDSGRTFQLPRGIFSDPAQGEILVADAGGHRVQIFDSEGWPRYEFTHWVERGGELIPGEPGAVAATASGNIFLIDILSRDLHILNFRGQPLHTIPPEELLPDEADATLSLCLAVGPDGTVFAICRAASGHHLIEFDDTGRVLARTRLGVNGDLVQVTGLAVDAGRVYVSDLAAKTCVHVFDRDGRQEMAFGIHDTGWGNFSFPAGIAVDSQGHIWVVDQIRQIVNRFDADGKFVGFLGGRGEGPGSMSYPCAVATDRADRILVLEKVGRRFQAFVMPKGGAAARS